MGLFFKTLCPQMFDAQRVCIVYVIVFLIFFASIIAVDINASLILVPF